MPRSEVDALVEKLALKPHPEGGFYRETYRSSERVKTPRGERSASTAILFLLPAGTFSRLHRIQSDEAWHFYAGGPLVVVEIEQRGLVVETRLGPGGEFQRIVPAGRWFGAYPVKGFALVGCTVAPGFEFADFELGRRAELLKAFPTARAAIERLTDPR